MVIASRAREASRLLKAVLALHYIAIAAVLAVGIGSMLYVRHPISALFLAASIIVAAVIYFRSVKPLREQVATAIFAVLLIAAPVSYAQQGQQPTFQELVEKICSQEVQAGISFFFLSSQILIIVLLALSILLGALSYTATLGPGFMAPNILGFFASRVQIVPELLLLFLLFLANTHTLFKVSASGGACTVSLNQDFVGAFFPMILVMIAKAIGLSF